MNRSIRPKKGFTLIELLVVISIISLLSSVVLASLNSARAKARDAQRIANIKQLQNALELYFSANGAYPLWDGSTEYGNDCSDSTGGVDGFRTVLQPLVTAGVIPAIPDDPNYPNTPWPQCFFYHTNISCQTGDPVHPYILIFRTESTQLKLNSWNNEANRWCVFP